MNQEKYNKDIEFLQKLGYKEQYKNSNIWELKGKCEFPLLEYNYRNDCWRTRRTEGFYFVETPSPAVTIIEAYDSVIKRFESEIKYIRDAKEKFIKSLKEEQKQDKEEVNE